MTKIMRKALFRCGLLILLIVLLISREPIGSGAGFKSIAIVNVTIIDGTGSPPKPNITVIITGNTITKIAPAGQINIPQNVLTIPGDGKFLIPGLWDMHVHTENYEWGIPDEDSSMTLSDYYDAIKPSDSRSHNVSRQDARRYLSMYIANGVTGVRDMYTVNSQRFGIWLNDIVSGRLIGPRIIKGGADLGSEPRPFITVEMAKQALVDTESSGAKFLKVHDFVNREAYYAIAQLDKYQRFPFVGHVPIYVTAFEASNAGQLSIEHLTGVLLACSTHEAEIRQRIIRACQVTKAADGKGNSKEGMADACALEMNRSNRREIIETFDRTKAKSLADTFVKNKTWQCPTLVQLRRKIGYDQRYVDKSLLKYFTFAVKSDWEVELRSFNLSVDAKENEKEIKLQKEYFQKQLQVVDLMRKAGVRFIAGTDTGVSFMFPGFSLHDELELFVQAGFTPMEAIQTATYNAAESHGMLSWYGTVAEGKIADLVLLDQNPLRDISNTRKIAAVFVDGNYLDKSALHRILDDIQNRAGN